MSLTRRRFLAASAGLAFAGLAPYSRGFAQQNLSPIKAIAFDAFPIFDPRPVFGLTKKLFPEHGMNFAVLWRTRIFEYTWLLTNSGRYQSFWQCINDALSFTANQLNVSLSAKQRDQLMNAFLSLKAYPDVKPVLEQFKRNGIKLAFLSNMTEKMLNSGIANSSLAGYFDEVLSTDRVKAFKPDPRAYQMAIDAFGFNKQQIVFCAFASWDAIGAKWFGYPTVWVNRLSFKAETLPAKPDAVGTDIQALKTFIAQRQHLA